MRINYSRFCIWQVDKPFGESMRLSYLCPPSAESTPSTSTGPTRTCSHWSLVGGIVPFLHSLPIILSTKDNWGEWCVIPSIFRQLHSMQLSSAMRAPTGSLPLTLKPACTLIPLISTLVEPQWLWFIQAQSKSFIKKKKMGLVKREKERIELEFLWESLQFKFWRGLYWSQVKT